MAKVKTSDLTGAALDWAVAKCEGFEVAFTTNKEVMILRKGVTDYFDPHHNWGWGGPIIEREQITLKPEWDGENAYWTAISITGYEGRRAVCSGSTALMAAMRCYVASKLGDVVDVPDELL